MKQISEKIKRLKDDINSTCAKTGRDPESITLVVVTKSTTIDCIKKVIKLGMADLGENRVQQLKKVSTQVSEFLSQNTEDESIPKKINWHMIGHLQRNKVRPALTMASLIHSVDTLRLAEELNTAAGKLNLKPKILLQVNTSLEPQKYGVPVGAATHLAEQFQTMSNLNLVGLMTMAPLTRNKDIAKACFSRARELFWEIKGERMVGPEFSELSMGMSGDYIAAIEEGATILRIGSAIFS